MEQYLRKFQGEKKNIYREIEQILNSLDFIIPTEHS